MTVVDDLDPPERAEVDTLVADVAAATGHSPLADGKLVVLHGRVEGFTVLAREHDELVGAAVGIRPDEGEPVWSVQEAVHPAASGGLRDELARRAVEEAGARGAARIRWWAVEAGEEDDALAGRLGLAPWRDVVQMRRLLVPLSPRSVPGEMGPLGPLPEPLRLPKGIRLRSFVPGDDDAEWLEVNRRAFSAHPEQGGFTEAGLLARMAEEWFDPEDFLVAEDRKGMAGFCWVKVPDRAHGEIYVIAVDPRRRGSGLGRALVLAGMAAMAVKGVPEARLYVDGANEAGLALYESLGFSRHHVDRAYTAAVRD